MTLLPEIFLQNLLDSLPMLVIVYEQLPDSTFRLVTGSTSLCYTAQGENYTGRLLSEILAEEDVARVSAEFRACLASGEVKKSVDWYSVNDGFAETFGKRICTENISVPMPQQPGQNPHILIMMQDITAQMHHQEQEQQERAQQEAIIAQQQAALAELSTPLLAISDETVVMPIIGTVDSRRIQQIMSALLEGVSEQGARTVILDITGVPIVDTQVANALLRASQAVKLLGAQIVLTGIRPEVAQTLVGLGVDLAGIITRSSLQSGIAYALQRERSL